MYHFYTKSDRITEIIKGLGLTKTLFVSSILIGPRHQGKKTLLRSLFPDAMMVSCGNQEELQETLLAYDELIITDFEKLTNPEELDFTNKRILATANYVTSASVVDNIFAFIYDMPSLDQRPCDIKYLGDMFLKEACSVFEVEVESVDVNPSALDLSSNSSLKKSIYKVVSKQTMSKEDIQEAIYDYVLDNLEGSDGYSQYLGLYEKPLIEAGLKKYGSQLRLSSILGINRNTLRKKIHEHRID